MLIDAYEFGVSVITKSELITRDIDLYKQISEHSPVLCKMTITTANDELCRKIEPNVSPSSERFQALAKMSEAGLKNGNNSYACSSFYRRYRGKYYKDRP